MHALLEGGGEGAVAVVAALLGQVLCDDSLAPAQQQVEAQHGAHGSSCAVEQEIQCRQWSYLFGHIVLFTPQVCD